MFQCAWNRRQSTAGCLELESLLVDLAGQSPIGQEGRAEEIQCVRGLNLSNEGVVVGSWEIVDPS